MRALCIFAGPRALTHLRQQGLQANDIAAIPAAAGGPKGLILGPLDRFIFGDWLPASSHTVHLVGASIGAWRMATACLHDPVAGLQRLEHDYIHQNYPLKTGEKRPPPERVSALFGANLHAFYNGRVSQILHHPRFRLHVLTARGRGLLARDKPWRTVAGFPGAYLANLVARLALAGFLQRVVFSGADPSWHDQPAALPFDARDFSTRQVVLNESNFLAAMQASCSIPFVLRAVHDIVGAPAGAYWDGGVTDYHLHLNWQGLVLYPHFQRSVVPGWLDKHLRWRHRASAFLDRLILLAPHPDWVRCLPGGKLPDRTDFTRYGSDLAARVHAWTQAASASQQLADEFAAWLKQPDPAQVQPL